MEPQVKVGEIVDAVHRVFANSLFAFIAKHLCNTCLVLQETVNVENHRGLERFFITGQHGGKKVENIFSN